MVHNGSVKTLAEYLIPTTVHISSVKLIVISAARITLDYILMMLVICVYVYLHAY